MRASRARPLVCATLAYCSLLRGEVCFQQQLNHADDAVHRRADFVAHVGQKAALRPIGGVGALAGVNQFLLVALLLGNLLGNSDDPNQLPGLVANGKSPVPDPFLLLRPGFGCGIPSRSVLPVFAWQTMNGPVARSSGWIASTQDIGFW